MTDKLREALKQIAYFYAVDHPLDDPMDAVQFMMDTARAALAAAPQPAAVDRESLADLIFDNLEVDCNLTDEAVLKVADALLARGLRLPGDETMAWAVVGEDGEVIPGSIYPTRDEAKRVCDYEGERVVRVAVRVVEGGDDA